MFLPFRRTPDRITITSSCRGSAARLLAIVLVEAQRVRGVGFSRAAVVVGHSIEQPLSIQLLPASRMTPTAS